MRTKIAAFLFAVSCGLAFAGPGSYYCSSSCSTVKKQCLANGGDKWECQEAYTDCYYRCMGWPLP